MQRFLPTFIALASLVPLNLCAEEPIDFVRDIRPILSDKCVFCHGPDENQRQADLRLDTHDGVLEDRDGSIAVVPGDLEKSLLIERITSDDPFLKMPPSDSKRSLSDKEIDLLKQWVAQGAPWEEHWSFIAPKRPELPDVKQDDWPTNGIDAFILAKLEQEKLTPSERAKRETLIRRVTHDLTGLPPTLEEVDAFLADTSEHAYEKVVDRLLASPRYGEHMATSWLDVARYADSNGYQGERTRTMWPWRDWVVKAMNDNMPFDQFTIEQIAGDLLPDPSRAQLVATGFHRNHMLNGEGGRIAEESRVNYVIDRVNTTSTTWLGLTMACCQCHDHKYDPLAQNEYFQMYAYFNSIDESGAVDRGGNAKPVLALPSDAQLKKERELSAKLAEQRKQLAEMTSSEKQLAWETALLKKLGDTEREAYWNSLTPTEFVSEQGQTLEAKEDGSIFVSGKNPANDNYTLQYSLEAGKITGLRLDALKHDSFTNGGLARSDSGNFVLTDVVATIVLPDGMKSEPVFVTAEADFEQNGHPVAEAIDDDPKSGWAVYQPGDMKHNRSAVFVFAEPVEVPEGATLKLVLKHESPHASHNLGWFRFSTTSAPNPKLSGSNDPPPQIVAALKTESNVRSEEQKQSLNDYFREKSPEVVLAQKEFELAQKQFNDHKGSYLQTMVMEDLSKPRETYRLIRGAWDNPDKSQQLSPGTPAILPPLPDDAASNRLALARWLVSKQNPLTARVTVNRYWQQFFGTGLVKTAEDFGTQGELPSHPKLLDWLAVEFMESGWNVKGLHKLIVMSSTYRQSSNVTPEHYARDPYNRLLARGPRYRLSSQAIRDQALFLSGLLVEKVGGAPVKPYQPEGVWLDLTLGKIKYEQDHGEDIYRRSLYIFWRRSVGPTMLFDTPARQVCTVKQSLTNTPLHALTMMNETLYVESARKYAERVLHEGGDSDESRLAYAFRLATARGPSEREMSSLNKTLAKVRERLTSDPAAVDQLLGVGESPVDASLERQQIAVYAGMMNVILNLDEVLSKE